MQVNRKACGLAHRTHGCIPLQMRRSRCTSWRIWEEGSGRFKVTLRARIMMWRDMI